MLTSFCLNEREEEKHVVLLFGILRQPHTVHPLNHGCFTNIDHCYNLPKVGI